MGEPATVRVADVLRAALDVLSDEDYARLAARIDAIAEAATTYTPAEVAALLRRAAARRREIGIAADALAEAEYHAARDLDGDARVAAEADVQRAARALAAALRDDALTQTEEPNDARR